MLNGKKVFFFNQTLTSTRSTLMPHGSVASSKISSNSPAIDSRSERMPERDLVP